MGQCFGDPEIRMTSPLSPTGHLEQGSVTHYPAHVGSVDTIQTLREKRLSGAFGTWLEHLKALPQLCRVSLVFGEHFRQVCIDVSLPQPSGCLSPVTVHCH